MNKRGPRQEILSTFFDGFKSTEFHTCHVEVLQCGHDFYADDRRHNPNATHRYCAECLRLQGPVERARSTWNLQHNVY